ncbi:MAG: Smr/MutS family protein, partial [Bacteroidales bacterium]|nr:Smr/MutS family protein [Bacteroidales bacterium]
QTGLPADVLKAAQAKTGRRHLQFEQELQQIEVEKQQLSQRTREVETADRLLSDTLEKYRKLTAEIEERKSVYIKEAKTQAADIVAQANRRIEQTIREIKEQQAEREETRRLRGQLQADMAAILDEAEGMGGSPAEGSPRPAAGHTPKAHTPSGGTAKHPAKASAQPPLQVGGYVHRADGKEVGVIVELKGRKAKVDFDFMRLELPLEQLRALSPQEARNEAAKQGRVQVHIENLQTGRNEFSPYLDLRGERMHDALALTDKFIDEAVLYGESRLEILHGKGYGVLKENIRRLLRQNPHVAFFEDQKEELGGAGITLVTLKR